jgi:hypothetical protein
MGVRPGPSLVGWLMGQNSDPYPKVVSWNWLSRISKSKTWVLSSSSFDSSASGHCCCKHHSASGVVKIMPRPVVWGQLRYQGLGVCHLWTTQRVEHILAILRHATRSTLTGQLHHTSMEEMQLEILGVSQSFLAYSYSDYGSLATRSWITSTWHFLLESTITMKDVRSTATRLRERLFSDGKCLCSRL